MLPFLEKEPVTSESDVSIFPNPSHSKSNLQFSGSAVTGNMTITDLTGKNLTIFHPGPGQTRKFRKY